MSKKKVTEVSADMMLNMDKASVTKLKERMKNTSRHLKEDLAKIGDGAKDSLKDLTVASGGLGRVVGSAFSGLMAGGPVTMGLAAVAGAVGAIGLQAEHMSKQFDNAVSSMMSLKAQATGLQMSTPDFQRLKYLAEISGTDVNKVSTVIARLNLHSGEIQSKGANANAATRFLSQIWGGDGSNLSGDEKLNSFMKGLRELESEGRTAEARKVINDVSPIAARDPALQGFLLKLGLKNWSKAQNVKGVLTKKDVDKVASQKNVEARAQSHLEDTTLEYRRVGDHAKAMRENFLHVSNIENRLKDALASSASVVATSTKAFDNLTKAVNKFIDSLNEKNISNEMYRQAKEKETLHKTGVFGVYIRPGA